MAQMMQLNIDMENAYDELRKETITGTAATDPTKSFRLENTELRNYLTLTIQHSNRLL